MKSPFSTSALSGNSGWLLDLYPGGEAGLKVWMLTDQGEKVSPEDRSAIESGVRGLRDALAGDDREVITRAMQALEQASHKMAEELYKTAGTDAPDTAPGGDQGPQGPDAGGDDVIDAEFEVKE